MKSIYFDYNATTPLDPAVKAAMLPFFDEVWGNPSSVHHIGQRARSLLDAARERVALVFRSKPSEIVFTSGGTESNNLAIFGTARLLRDKGRSLVTALLNYGDKTATIFAEYRAGLVPVLQLKQGCVNENSRDGKEPLAAVTGKLSVNTEAEGLESGCRSTTFVPRGEAERGA